MECPNCRNKNDKNSKFCIKCGTNLKDKNNKSHLEDVLFVPDTNNGVSIRNIILGVVGVIAVLFLLLILADDSDYSNSDSYNDYQAQEYESAPSSEWTKFNSIEHSFSIDFPEYPDTERIPEETIEGISFRGTQYIASDEDENAYLAQVAEYDLAPYEYDNYTGIEGAINAMFDSDDYSIDNSKFTTFRSYDAAQFSFTDNVDGFVGQGVAFVRDDLNKVKLFIIVVISDVDPSTIYSKFVNSFQFTQ